MGVGIGVRFLAAVLMRLGSHIDGHDHKAPVANAPLGDHMLGEMPHIGVGATQYRHFKAGFVVEMDMQRRDGEIVMIVLGARQSLGERAHFVVVDIDQSGDAGAFAIFRADLLQARAGQVA